MANPARLLSFLLFGVGGCCFAPLMIAATPTPKYQVLLQEGRYEIRQYPRLILVSAPMTDHQDESSFGKLFRFISGKNQSTRKIPMTAPVLIDSRATRGSMSFIMPVEMAAKAVPTPEDPTLRRVTLPAAAYAVYRFSGGRNKENEAKAAAALQDWMIRKNKVAESSALFAYYNPPWIPVWFRRNEIWIRLARE